MRLPITIDGEVLYAEIPDEEINDKTLAENMARAQKLWKSINRRSVELCEPVDVATGGKAWTILYVSDIKEIKPVDLMYYRYFGNIWFDTKEHCQQVIDEFHDDLLWYFTEFKNRADM